MTKKRIAQIRSLALQECKKGLSHSGTVARFKHGRCNTDGYKVAGTVIGVGHATDGIALEFCVGEFRYADGMLNVTVKDGNSRDMRSVAV